jgi:hypothetical protein
MFGRLDVCAEGYAMTDLEELERIAGSGQSPEARRVARALASAMNDWPIPNLLSLEQFVCELRKEYGVLTFSNLSAADKKKGAASSAPWKAEALAGLLEAWDAQTVHLTLEELIAQMEAAS